MKMKRNKKNTSRNPQRRFHCDMHYPWKRSGNPLNAPSDRCFMSEFRNVIGELFSSSSENRGYRSIPDVFDNILHSASILDWEFRRLNYILYSKPEHSLLHTNVDSPKYTSEDIMYLDMAVKSVLKLISKIKEELMFREHYTSRLEGHQSLFKTKRVIHELETKLYSLLKIVDEVRLQLQDECPQIWNNTLDPRLKNNFGSHSCPLNSCLNNYCKSTCTCSKNCPSNKKKVHEHFCDKFKQKNITNVVSPTRNTHNTHSQPQAWALHESHANNTQFRESIRPNPKCIKRMSPPRDKVTHKVDPNYFDSKSLTQLHARGPLGLNILTNPHHTARRDEQFVKNKQRSRNTSMEERGYASDTQNNKKRFEKNRRKRTRAGKDNMRRNRSSSCSYIMQILEHTDKRPLKSVTEEIVPNGGYIPLRVNNDSYASLYSINVDNEEQRYLREIYKGPPSFWSETQSENQFIEERQTCIDSPPDNEIRQYYENDVRLASGGAFSLSKSPRRRQRRLSSKGKVPGKRRAKSSFLKRPSGFSINSSAPRRSRRRKPGKRRRKARKRRYANRPRSEIIYREDYEEEARKRRYAHRPRSEIIYRQDYEEEIHFQGVSNSCYSLPCDNYCYSCCSLPCDNYCYSCCTTSLDNVACPRPCPTDSSYCCGSRGRYSYQPILVCCPYPMCDNTGCRPATLVQSEKFEIEFEPPRRKKIVKRHIRAKKRGRPLRRVESQWISENYSESQENLVQTKSYKTSYCNPPPPIRRKSKYLNFYSENSKEVSTLDCESVEFESCTSYEPAQVEMLSQTTSTENVSTVDTKTSTAEVIRAVKAVATNTPNVSTKEIGTSTIPKIKISRPIETETKQTNTEKLMQRTIGTDPQPVPEKARIHTTNKATETTERKINKETNTLSEQKKRLTNVGTDTPKQKLQSKSTNTEPVKEFKERKPLTASKGTLIMPIRANKETNYDRVKTKEGGTDPIKTKMVDKTQQAEFVKPEPVILEAQFTEPIIGHKQVLSNQQLEHIQTLSKHTLNYQQTLMNKGEKEHIQYLDMDKVKYLQNLTSQTVEHTQVRTNLDIGHTQNLAPQSVNHSQSFIKQQTDYLQSVDIQPIEYLQNVERQQVKQMQTVERQHVKQMQIVEKQQVKQMQTTTVQPSQNTQTLVPQREEYAQNIAKDPTAHLQRLSKHQAKYTQNLETEKANYTSTYEPPPPEEHKHERPPPEKYKAISPMKTKRQRAPKRTNRSKLGDSPPPEEINVVKSSSDISMHLTLEKVHEEIFRRRCRFCKCANKCKCKCCNKLHYGNEKLIICEKKRSNTIRITNRSDCQIKLKGGEEIISDVDSDVSFKIAS